MRRRHNTNEITFTTRGPSGGDDPDDVSNRTAVVAQNQGNWYQLIARYDGVRRQIIINGDTTNLALDIASTGNINDGPERLVFGARMKNGESGTALGNIEAFSKTKLDDIFIYNRALTDAEVATMYNGGAALPRAAGAGAAAVGDLRGNGTIDASGSGGIEVTGDLAPGNSVGQIDITGDLAFADDSSYTVSVDGTDADLVTVDGDVTIGTDVLLAIDGTPTADSYDILTYTGSLAGTFDDTQVLLQGYQVTYAPGVVSITPEPGTMALLGLGGAVILVRRRRRA